MPIAQRSRWRSRWVQVHLCVGVTLGVIGALIGLAGSALVFDHEIDEWLNPQRYAISGARVALRLADYAQRAGQSLADSRVVAIRLPDQEPGPVVALARGRDGGTLQRAYLDPPTGRVLDTSASPDLVAWLHGFHESLTLRDYGGREIVGVVGIAMLASALSGIYLWWPAGGLRRSAFGFRRGFGLHRNLHYTIGFWGAIVLAILSFTGIWIAYPDAGRAVVGAIGPLSPSLRGVRSQSTAGDPIKPDDAANAARGLYQDARVVGIGFPANATSFYRVSLREAGDTMSRSGTVVCVDPRSSAILCRVDASTRTRGDALLLWNRIVHEGGAFGLVGRVLTFLGGLLPALLAVTGVLIWLRKRSRRRLVVAPGSIGEQSRS